MDSLNTSLYEPLWLWGGLLVIGFPLLVVLLGEAQHHLERHQSPWAAVVRFIQRFVIPQFVLLLIMTKVLDWPSDDLFVKIVETLLGIFVIYASLSILKLTFFTESNSSWKIQIPKLLQDVIRIFILAIGTAIVLSNTWGFDLGKLLTALGLGSVGLGFAMQDTFKSLFAGFTLVSSKYINVGDWVEIEGRVGRVISIDFRTVTIMNFDHDVDVFPSVALLSAKCTNFTSPDPRHITHVGLHLPFAAEPDVVKQTLIKTALAIPHVLPDPEPGVEIVEFKSNGVVYDVTLCLNDYAELENIRHQFAANAWYALARAGVSFPIPKQHVTLFKPDASAAKREQVAINTILSKAVLLVNCPSEAMTELAQHAKQQVFGAKELITQQDRYTDQLYIIVSGQVVEHHRSDNGRQYTLNTLTEGDMFGFKGLMKQGKECVSVQALNAVTVVGISYPAVLDLLHAQPALRKTMQAIADNQLKELSNMDNN